MVDLFLNLETLVVLFLASVVWGFGGGIGGTMACNIEMGYSKLKWKLQDAYKARRYETKSEARRKAASKKKK
jgi:hypothetical protein